MSSNTVAGTESLINSIKSKIMTGDQDFSSWYVGIANNVKRKLFEDHNVNEQNGIWIYVTAPDNAAARTTKSYFVQNRVAANDLDDEVGGLIVYAYKKTPSTRP